MPDPAARSFAFRFDPRFRPILLGFGATPGTARVDVTPDRVRVRFGPWSMHTPLANVARATVTGPYSPWRGVGIRTSLKDRGITFGTNAEAGVCLELRQPVRGPLKVLRHPGITVTVAEPERLLATLADAGVAVAPG